MCNSDKSHAWYTIWYTRAKHLMATDTQTKAHKAMQVSSLMAFSEVN